MDLSLAEITIRPATIQDAAGIARVHVEGWQNAYRGQIPDDYLDNLSIEKRTVRWTEQLTTPQPGVFNFVAEHDHKIVGWSSVGISRDDNATPDCGELYAIYLLPEYIGKGVGAKLMSFVLDVLRTQGYQKATLWVLITNQKSRDWYERRGWKNEGTTKVDHRENYDLNDVRYIIDL